MKKSNISIVSSVTPLVLSDINENNSDITVIFENPQVTKDLSASNLSVFMNEEPIKVSEDVDIQIVYSEDFKYYEKEKEWVALLGEERFNSLDNESKEFLVKTAGAIHLGTTKEIRNAIKQIDEV